MSVDVFLLRRVGPQFVEELFAFLYDPPSTINQRNAFRSSFVYLFRQAGNVRVEPTAEEQSFAAL